MSKKIIKCSHGVSNWWEGRRIEFTGGWVTVLNVPPFLRLIEFFFSLADWCRVLEERERLGWEELWLDEVCFRAWGNSDGFTLF